MIALIWKNQDEQEENSYVRTLPSLQKLFGEEIKKRGEGKKPKEQLEIIKEAKIVLTTCMDKELLQRSGTFQKNKENDDNEAYWQIGRKPSKRAGSLFWGIREPSRKLC